MARTPEAFVCRYPVDDSICSAVSGSQELHLLLKGAHVICVHEGRDSSLSYLDCLGWCWQRANNRGGSPTRPNMVWERLPRTLRRRRETEHNDRREYSRSRRTQRSASRPVPFPNQANGKSKMTPNVPL